MQKQLPPFSLRVKPAILLLIKTEAKKQGRSTNKQIEIWLNEKVKQLNKMENFGNLKESV